MRAERLGESALILRDLPRPAPEIAALLEGAPGVAEAWAAFDTVGVVLDGTVPVDAFRFDPPLSGTMPPGRRHHMVPVLYDGEDLMEVACRLDLWPQEIPSAHTRYEYECRAVGFCPGFAYLTPVFSDEIWIAPTYPLDLPRRDAPRPRVAPGSVALAAGMTAVYPLERPGGWWLVGRTPLILVDEADDYFPIRAGDRVRFVAIGADEFERRKGERLPPNV